MVVLDDGEVADLSVGSLNTVDLELRSRDKRIEKILHQPEDADRGSYAHFMHKEIHEQPSALDRSLRGRSTQCSGLHAWVGSTIASRVCSSSKRVVFFAAAPACTAHRSAPT